MDYDTRCVCRQSVLLKNPFCFHARQVPEISRQQCFQVGLWVMLTPSFAYVASGYRPPVSQYFLTESQQRHLDHERRLTADHLRRLNQVLAGHLSYLEVAKVHADRENVQALAAAPSHGSAVGHSSSLNDVEDAKGAPRASRRQNILRRLVSKPSGWTGES